MIPWLQEVLTKHDDACSLFYNHEPLLPFTLIEPALPADPTAPCME